MKKIIKIIIIPILLFAAQFFFSYKPLSRPDNANYTSPSNDSLFGGLFLQENMEEDISRKDYILYKGMFENIKNTIEYKNNAKLNSRSSFSVGGIGINEYEKNENRDYIFNQKAELLTSKDSIFFKNEIKRFQSCLSNLDTKNLIYFSFGEYELKDFMIKSFVLNDTGYLAVPNLIKNEFDKNINSTAFDYERKELKIKYDIANKRILIPLSNSAKNIVTVLIYVFGFIIIALTMSIYLYSPFRIIKNISLGKAFAKENIIGLKVILRSTIILTLIVNLCPFILHFCLLYYIPNELRLISADKIFLSLLESYCYCFVIYSIYKAFKKGYDLQQENELTV